MPGYPDGDIFRTWRKAPGDRQRREVQFQEKIGVKARRFILTCHFILRERKRP